MPSSERPTPARALAARRTAATVATSSVLALLAACESSSSARSAEGNRESARARPEPVVPSRKEQRKVESIRDAREFDRGPTAADVVKEKEAAAGDSVEAAERPVLGIDVTSYHLTGSFDWATQSLSARVDVALDLEGASKGGRVILDAAVETIEAVELIGAGRLDFTHDKSLGALTIDVPGASSAAATGKALLRITYLARESGSLRAIEARAGDPSDIPVVYTTSEPLGAARWMPCHNTPSDRAAFGVTLSSALGERVVANGALEAESVDDKGTRTTTWRTAYTLPTYLMAFAVGAFQVSEERLGGVPLSVWSRQGVRVDTAGLLSMLRAQTLAFERLLVPYPFEKYAVVLLPDFPAGGIEHAGVTFQRETRSTESSLVGDFGLYAHELAHQWFGDYVTVADWDELWIKEGMATLLAAEATRGWDDRSRARHFMGHAFGFVDGEAIRDPSLLPGQKYNSGPYDRSAWFFTQVRSLVGEDAFWAAMRDLLKGNAWETLDQEEVLTRFARDLGEGWKETARAALSAKKVPVLSLEGRSVSLRDEEGALVAPLDFRAIDNTGSVASTTSLTADESFELPGAGATPWIQVDPRQVHPWIGDWLEGKALVDVGALQEALRPKTPEQVATIGALPAPTQAFLLSQGLLSGLPKDEFSALFPLLSSDSAQYAALVAACSERDAAKDAAPDVLASWDSMLRGFLDAHTFRGYDRRGPGLVACASSVEQAKTGLARALLARPDRGKATDAEILELSLTYFEPATAPALWKALATRGQSLRVREIALQTLAKYFSEPRLASITSDTKEWIPFVGEALRTLTAVELAGGVMDVADALSRRDLASDAGPFLDAVAVAFEARLAPGVQRRAVCAAYRVAKETEAFEAFRARVTPLAVDPTVKALLANPAACVEAR